MPLETRGVDAEGILRGLVEAHVEITQMALGVQPAQHQRGAAGNVIRIRLTWRGGCGKAMAGQRIGGGVIQRRALQARRLPERAMVGIRAPEVRPRSETLADRGLDAE